MQVDLGVFLPVSNNGWIISRASPQYKPTFELNREITLKAESLGFEFVLSMAKWRGYGGETQHWDYTQESITMMAGLAAATSTIDLYATIHPTTLNPYVAAKMLTTIDDISGGRIGLNIATGWDKVELGQFGLWPGDQHYGNRYDYAEEWLHVARTLWEEGRCTFDGEFFQMDDALAWPMPGRHIPIVNAGMSPRGLEFSAKLADTSFIGARDEAAAREVTTTLRALREGMQGKEGASAMKVASLFTIVAAETDEAAQELIEEIQAAADLDALNELVRRTTGASVSSETLVENLKSKAFQCTVIAGSPETVAQRMRSFAASGVDAFLLTFPDFLADLDFFGREVVPLLDSDRQAA
jgi:pyrimidine oxygenase